MIVSFADPETPLRFAVIVTVFFGEPFVVITLKVANFVFPTIVTLSGTVTEASLDWRATFIPAIGAGPVRVTVPVVYDPPVTEV